MKRNLTIVHNVARLLVALQALALLSLAQMGGGMRGRYGSPMGSGSLGGMMGGSLSGMMGGGSGLTVGSDGMLYITRSTIPTQGQPASTQLAAIDPKGVSKWTLPIQSGSASQPALGQDGTLFLTTSNWLNWMYDWMYSRSIPVSASASNLLVVKSSGASASIAVTIPLAGQLASAPQIAADGAGGYIVYVVTVDAFSGNTLNTGSTSGCYLYAFSPDGVLKYRMQLIQGGGSGMMGF